MNEREFGKKLTDAELSRIYREVGGVNTKAPDLQSNVRDEINQRTLIAKTIAKLTQVTDPMVLMTMLVVGLGFLADAHNVDREHLCKVLREARQRHAVEMSTEGG